MNIESVSFTPVFDEGPGRYRIGLIAMATDYATERDFRNMLPGDEVAFFVNRVENSSDINPETLRAMEPLLTDAAKNILPNGRLDAIAFSCTAATAVMGHDCITKAIQASRPDVPCITPLSGALAAFKAMKIKRVAVLTPNIDVLNNLIAERITESGVEVVAFKSFKFEDDMLMANLSPLSIAKAAIELDTIEADAIFISCTALRSVEVIQQLESTLGKPVITSIQAMFWQSLRTMGYTKPISNFGRLFEEH
ncbi:maleate cis-trans isomerase family protein [Pseudomonas serbica]|jgi:maleate isomerase